MPIIGNLPYIIWQSASTMCHAEALEGQILLLQCEYHDIYNDLDIFLIIIMFFHVDRTIVFGGYNALVCGYFRFYNISCSLWPKVLIIRKRLINN